MPTLRHRRHRSLPAPFWPGESILLARPAVMAAAHLRRDPVTVAWPGYVPGGQRGLDGDPRNDLAWRHATAFKTHTRIRRSVTPDRRLGAAEIQAGRAGDCTQILIMEWDRGPVSFDLVQGRAADLCRTSFSETIVVGVIPLNAGPGLVSQ